MPSRKAGPIRILLLSANPTGTTLLPKIEDEARDIRQALQQSSKPFQVELARAVRTRDFRRELLRYEPQFVHFSGHGQKARGILLQDVDGSPKLVSAAGLSALFKSFKTTRCVFLNSCYSQLQAKAIAQHIDYVIGTTDSITDDAAVELAVAFYDGIANGKSIPAAFELAVNSLQFAEVDAPSNIAILERKRPLLSRPVSPVHLQQPSVTNSAAEPLAGSPSSQAADGRASIRRSDARAQVSSRLDHEILPPSAPYDYLQEVITTLLQERELVIFLGAGASQEGRQGDRPFPAFSELVAKVLADAGVGSAPTDSRIDLFQAVVNRWYQQRRSLSAALETYLHGEPGFAHYTLAALSLSLFPEARFLLYLTTNYDDLMARAFHDLERVHPQTKTVTLSLSPSSADKAADQKFGAIEAHLRNGRPVVLKLFGDLDSEPPVFKTDHVRFAPEIQTSLEGLLRNPMLFIGYSFSDMFINKLLLQSNSRAPVFVVTPQGRLPEKLMRSPRVCHLRQTFSEFMVDLLASLLSRAPVTAERVDKVLSLLDPTRLYTTTELISLRARQASTVPLLRVRERLPAGQQGAPSEEVLVSRDESQPDVHGFLIGERQILAIIGDSGTGKSTFLYQLYDTLGRADAASACIVIFYDVHEIQPRGSLSAQLAHDFRCTEAQLPYLLESFHKLLTAQRQTLLILVDALNESSPLPPSTLKTEIESLAQLFATSIKLIYTCRKVYWDTFLAGVAALPSRLYFGAREHLLGKFSRQEAEMAFHRYQQLYGFRGTFADLRKELQERLCDPLMLRMLAEGYQKRQLPEFAPAVLIFDVYFERLQRRFRGTKILHFLERLVAIKLEAFTNSRGLTTDIFQVSDLLGDHMIHLLTMQQAQSPKLPGDPFVILEDEGILSALDPEHAVFKFNYDRFYEYMLGRALGQSLTMLSSQGFIAWVKELTEASYSQHFSFLEALKAEIIRRNISDQLEACSLFSAATLTALLHDSDKRVVGFSRDVVRELAFESNTDILPVLRSAVGSEEEWQLLVLDIASDSPKVIPVLSAALLSGTRTLMRRSVHYLLRTAEPALREHIEDLLLGIVANNGFTRQICSGLIYYSAALCALADRTNQDPFPHIQAFWSRVFRSSTNSRRDMELLAHVFADVVKVEGPLFFSAEARLTPIDYLWTELRSPERALTAELRNILVDLDELKREEQRQVVLFFGSELRYWALRDKPNDNPVFAYPFEYCIAEWLLIARAQNDFHGTLEILDSFAGTGFWLSVDFALCTMEFILRYLFPDNVTYVAMGFNSMKEWTLTFQRTQPDRFFASLEASDPFLVNYIPIAQLAGIDLIFNTVESAPVSVLVEELGSNEAPRARLALLATRYLWRERPRSILATLRFFAQSEDAVLTDWVNRILKEIFLVYPRLVEEFFRLNRFAVSRMQDVKERADVEDSVGPRHNGDALLKALFLRGEERRNTCSRWYQALLESNGFDVFCETLVDSVAESLASGPAVGE